MKHIFLAILISTISFTATSGEVDMAVVKRLMISRQFGQMLFIELDKSQASPLSCHSNSSWEFVLDVTGDLGQKMYSSILTLYASGKPGRFVGDDTCSVYSVIETLDRVELK